jgi:hypothetical protein
MAMSQQGPFLKSAIVASVYANDPFNWKLVVTLAAAFFAVSWGTGICAASLALKVLTIVGRSG